MTTTGKRESERVTHKHWVIVGPSGKPFWDWYCRTRQKCKDYFGSERDWLIAKKKGYTIRRVETKLIG